MAYRDSASFGKRQEFVAIAELLRRGFDVYLTLVDDQQIDCVVCNEILGEPVYLDIQIKARSKQCNRKTRYICSLGSPKSSANFFHLFFRKTNSIGSSLTWLIKEPTGTRRAECRQITASFSPTLAQNRSGLPRPIREYRITLSC